MQNPVTNEIRTLILGLPPSTNSGRWFEWIHPGFSPGGVTPAEKDARSALLGRPTSRESAEFAATVLTRSAMGFSPCRSAMGRVFGKISFSFPLGDRLVLPSFDPPSYSVRSAVTDASGSILRIAARHEESDKLARSEWFNPASGFPFVAVSAAILAISTKARLREGEA